MERNNNPMQKRAVNRVLLINKTEICFMDHPAMVIQSEKVELLLPPVGLFFAGLTKNDWKYNYS